MTHRLPPTPKLGYFWLMQNDGLLLIDKPEGLTSHDVVARVRRVLKTKAVGHCGTLDPMATGLLVLLLGKATKLSDYLLKGDKRYQARIHFGRRTDSLDRTGKDVQPVQEVLLREQDIGEWIGQASGNLELPIPLFSAKKVKGKKLCDYARSGQDVEVPIKQMNFYDIEVLSVEGAYVDVRLSCSKGGFIRAWAEHLGRLAGCGAVLHDLRRLYSAPFDLKVATGLEAFEQKIQLGAGLEDFGSSFMPMSRALPHWRGVTVRGKEERLLTHGQVPMSLQRRLIFEQKQAVKEDRDIGIRVHQAQTGRLLSLLEAGARGGLKIRRSFPGGAL